MSDDYDLKRIPIWLRILVVGVLLAAASLLLLYAIKFGPYLSSEQEIWGQFGDYLGGILNPLFALTALFALLWTIVLQSKELKDSSKQLRRSAEALQLQNSVLTKQTFEATFFQLTALYGSVVNAMKLDLSAVKDPKGLGGTYEGRQCLGKMLEILLQAHLEKVVRGDYQQDALASISREYRLFYKQYGHLIGHYFRTIYHTVLFVHRSQLLEKEKQFYVKLLRAQLSRDELGLLFYNCISTYGRKRLLPLVKEYNLLKHLENEVLASEGHRDVLNQI